MNRVRAHDGDDHELRARELPVCDALYASGRQGAGRGAS
jgi:hypothetical protein